MYETYTVDKIERSAGMFDWGDEQNDYTIHHEHGETQIQNNYASDVSQRVSDKCEELLGDADEVEPEGVVIETGKISGDEIDDGIIRRMYEVDQ